MLSSLSRRRVQAVLIVSLLVVLRSPGWGARDRALVYCPTDSVCDDFCDADCKAVFTDTLTAAGAKQVDISLTLTSLENYRLILVSAPPTTDVMAETLLTDFVKSRAGRVVVMAEIQGVSSELIVTANRLMAAFGESMRLTTTTSGAIRCPAGPGAPVAAHPLMDGVKTLEHNGHPVVTADAALEMGRDDEGGLLLAGTREVVLVGDETLLVLHRICPRSSFTAQGNLQLLANLWTVPLSPSPTADGGTNPDDGGTTPNQDDAGPAAPGGDSASSSPAGCACSAVSRHSDGRAPIWSLLFFLCAALTMTIRISKRNKSV